MRLSVNRRRAVVSCAVASVVLGGSVTIAAAAAETITAHVTTAHPMVGQELDIAGQVSNAASYPVMISVTRYDDANPGGTPAGTTTTNDNQGDFTFADTNQARGSVKYRLSANDASGASVDVPVQVAGKPTDISVAAKPNPADANSSVHVTAHLGSPTTDRTVTLYAQPYQQGRQQFDSGAVDANGNREADHPVQRRTTFIASFAGDTEYAPASARVTVRVRAVIDAQLRGGYGSRGGYRLYHRNASVDVFIHLQPEFKGACVVMRAQRKSRGSWHNAAVSGCGSDAIRTNSAGQVIAQLQPPHIVGVPYRLRAEYRGGDGVAARSGRWLLLRFQG